MKLYTALLVRNEASKFLTEVLTRCLEFSDTVLVLDDNSTDDSFKIAKELGCAVKKRTKPPMWGQEASARQELWDWGVERCKQEDWLLICDSDQVLVGDLRPLMESWESNTILFTLYDCWSPTEYRADGYWQAHTNPRPWMFRPHFHPVDWKAEWPERGLHVGHFPQNWVASCPIHDPSAYWLHYSYLTPELRKAKYEQYVAKADILTPHELAHTHSILDGERLATGTPA